MTRFAWVAAGPGLGHPGHPDPELGAHVRARAGPAAGALAGVAGDYQQAQPAQTAQDRAQPWELARWRFGAAASRSAWCGSPGMAIMPPPGLTLRAGDGAIIAATGPE